MKTFMIVAALVSMSLPMFACEHTVAENDRTTHHLLGPDTHENTTVKENDLTGDKTIEQHKNSY